MSNRSSGANAVTIQKEINILRRKQKNLCENITSGAALIPVCLQVSSVDSIFANLIKLNGQPHIIHLKFLQVSRVPLLNGYK
jgi:hypothetical protein